LPKDLEYMKDKRNLDYASISTHYRRVLVVCIDRDNDLGKNGGVETPVFGRDQCISAGTRLAIEDPEDADANSIFGAVKIYEELVTKGYETEVAVIAGAYNRGVEADEKISSELIAVLSKFKAEGIVIVSDGEDDETVIPLIQAMIPVISIQRIIMRHSRSVEYSYAVFGKYIKMLIYDPRYSKFFLGVPGALLIASGFATIFGFTREALALVLSILGVAFVIRAFDIDKAIGSLNRTTPSTFIRIFSTFAGIMIILVGISNGISSIPDGAVPKDASITGIITNRIVVGDFVHGSITLIWIGLGTIFGGILLSNWFKGSIRILSDILRLVILGLIFIPAIQFTSVLTEKTNPFNLISSLFIGLAITLVATTFLFQYFRNKKGGEHLKH
jgi:Predicted membrane protein